MVSVCARVCSSSEVRTDPARSARTDAASASRTAAATAATRQADWHRSSSPVDQQWTAGRVQCCGCRASVPRAFIAERVEQRVVDFVNWLLQLGLGTRSVYYLSTFALGTSLSSCLLLGVTWPRLRHAWGVSPKGAGTNPLYGPLKIRDSITNPN